MQLRPLEPRDAALMLEWMHDESVVAHLSANFAAKTLDDCLRFIEAAQNTTEDLHLAIADEDGTYMGTVSLKHISGSTAEFAITIRQCAMGKGYSRFGMEQILKLGLERLRLSAIYWCVCPDNCRAVRFYDKNGYTRTNSVPEKIRAFYAEDRKLIWYVYQ